MATAPEPGDTVGVQTQISEERFREVIAKAFPRRGRVVSISVLHWSASVLVTTGDYGQITLAELVYIAEALGAPHESIKLWDRCPNAVEILFDLDPPTPSIRPPGAPPLPPPRG